MSKIVISSRFPTTKIAFVVLVTFFFLTSTGWSQINAQTQTPFEKARQDYSFQNTKYQDAHEKYISAKINYLAFNTAVAKNEAFIKTQQYAVQLHDVYITYLLLINERSNLYDWGTSGYNKEEEHKLIQEEIKSLENLKEQATKLTTLEETVLHTQKLKEQISKKTLPAAHRLLIRTDIAQLLELEYLFGLNAQNIDAYATKAIPENDKPLLQTWQAEISDTRGTIRQTLNPKEVEVKNTKQISEFDLKKIDYKFSTDKERRIFPQTVELLKEMLNLI